MRRGGSRDLAMYYGPDVLGTFTGKIEMMVCDLKRGKSSAHSAIGESLHFRIRIDSSVDDTIPTKIYMRYRLRVMLQ